MSHFGKHSNSIETLIDVTEAMLHVMEDKGIDPETVSQRPEFTVLIHFLKSIIDGELNIPNELTDTLRKKSEELGFDLEDVKIKRFELMRGLNGFHPSINTLQVINNRRNDDLSNQLKHTDTT